MLEILPHTPHTFSFLQKKDGGKSEKHNRLFQISHHLFKVKFEAILPTLY